MRKLSEVKGLKRCQKFNKPFLVLMTSPKAGTFILSGHKSERLAIQKQYEQSRGHLEGDGFKYEVVINK